MCAAWVHHYMSFILYGCKHTCAYNTDEIKLIVLISCVCTKRVHDSLQTHTSCQDAHTKFRLCAFWHACKLYAKDRGMYI